MAYVKAIATGCIEFFLFFLAFKGLDSIFHTYTEPGFFILTFIILCMFRLGEAVFEERKRKRG